MSPDGLVTGELVPVLSSDLDGGDTSFDVISARERAAVHEVLVVTLCERALLAMTHSRWSQAGVQTSYAIPLVCAVQARAALHRGDIPAARQELIGAQRLRHLLTYAMPRIATQTRIELARVYLALGDFAGAETLIQEIAELLQRRPDLSSLADEAGVLQARLPEERCPSASGESALTCAELRLLPMLATHLTFPQIAATMSLSPNTIKSQAYSLYRKLGASSRAEAVARSRQRAGLEA